MIFKRQIESEIQKKMDSGKIILLIGPRQVGKTTLIKTLLSESDYLFLDGDETTVQAILETANTEVLRNLTSNYDCVFIDEAQRIKEIALKLKIMHDQLNIQKLIVSGSSAFELNSLMQEPLTGRKWTFHLHPITWLEFEQEVGYLKSEQMLEQVIITGLYPEILKNPSESADLLVELTESVLFKDVYAMSGIRKPKLFVKLAKSLAWQIGQEVSYSELSGTLGLDVKTISHYVDLLEQNYLIFQLPAFSRNHRNEIKTNKKIYFYDNGIRNALIGDFKPISIRMDKGALWENFLISERKKQISYSKSRAQSYFWRTKQQQEIDYIEEATDTLLAAEIKWSEQKRIRFSSTFTSSYPAELLGVHRGNFRDFIKTPFV